ncbi:MAG: hypothetical protein ACKOBL_20575 [Chloroflexota bacterium]
MFDAKLFADFITAARGVLGISLIWLAFTQGANALSLVVLLMLLDWTGDFIDGTIAKHSRHPRRTRVGDSDLYIDTFVSIGLGIYLVASGFVSNLVALFYILGGRLILGSFGLDRNLLMLSQAPIYLWFILVTLQLMPERGYWIVAWVLIATTINWRRFSKDIVPKFISGVTSMWRNRHS